MKPLPIPLILALSLMTCLLAGGISVIMARNDYGFVSLAPIVIWLVLRVVFVSRFLKASLKESRD